MNCPSCKGLALKPTHLEVDLPAYGCGNCGGAAVSLLDYRHWIENHPLEAEIASRDRVEVQPDDTTTVLLCPKCSSLMTKYRISAVSNNRVDLCVSCNEVWLDHGEWELIKFLEVADRLPEVFREGWQRRVVAERARRQREDRFRELFGPEYDEVERIKAWIDDHPHRLELLAYLNSIRD